MTFLIERNGEDVRFKNSKFKAANGSLRARPEDISSPAELAKTHKDYYFRVLMGPCFRADMISIFHKKKRHLSFRIGTQLLRIICHRMGSD
jgi:hypothetical protein